jgi:hypothetical protein
MRRLIKFKEDLFPLEKQHLFVMGGFSLMYLSWTGLVVGFRNDHRDFIIFLIFMFLTHRVTRTIVYSFIFFVFFWIIYDSMRVFPNYTINEVNIAEPYEIEKMLFGINHVGNTLTPNEFLKLNAHPFLDFLSGFFYLTWVPVPLALGIYLYFKDKKLLLQFSAAYLFTNLLGFVIYYVYPAAPPWYYETYGDQKLFDIPGSAAQLVRFDQLVGFPVFENIYTKNANVFAAIPSLHAAYPVVTWYYARKKQLFIASWLILIDVAGIWFAAVYSNHHYVIDVLLGLACAIAGIFIFEKFLRKETFEDLISKYLRFIN